MDNFADRLIDAIEAKQNPSMVGLDPDYSKLPELVKQNAVESPEAASQAMLDFNKVIIDSVKGIVPAVKLQSAFYEVYGAAGIKSFFESAEYAKSRGLIVVADVKRNDTWNSSRAYSRAYLGKGKPFDAITVNPYLGSDGIKPFIEDGNASGRGIFVLVKTSNPSSGEIQDMQTGSGRVYAVVARLVDAWGKGTEGRHGYQSVGAVVGATYPKDAKMLRKLMPKALFLVPGYGAQGGNAAGVMPCFNRDGFGAVVVSARGIIFASAGDDFGHAAKQAALKMKSDLTGMMRDRNICPW